MDLDRAREVLRTEAQALLDLAGRLGKDFAGAVDAVAACKGHLVVTGMGKAGLIGQKISATFASTGTPSIFLHPAEALHGDLGRVLADDVVLVLSNSGETAEVAALLPALRRITSETLSRRRPRSPPGWKRANCSRSKPRRSKTAKARASPRPSSAVVVAEGARPRGQASSMRPSSTTASAFFPSVESRVAVRATIFAPMRRRAGSRAATSAVSPLLERTCLLYTSDAADEL